MTEQLLSIPTLLDVYAARPRVYRALRPTALTHYPLLSAELGCRLFVKHENHNPTGAFKIRGGLNLIGSLSTADRGRGVVTASTGNHGQSIALACQREGVGCRVYVPLGNNPEKNAAMRGYGAEVVEHGVDFDEARERAEHEAAHAIVRYVHSANEPLLIAGVGTYALEIFEELPEVDYIFVPIGGGSGAAGIATVRRGVGSPARIIGVQAEQADAFARSWRGPTRVVGTSAATFAEGMATRVTFDLTFGLLQHELDDIVVLDEGELAEGVRMAIRATHNLAEGAGAAPLMAAAKVKDRLAGKTVVCVMSGGNLHSSTLTRILTQSAKVDSRGMA